MRQKLLRETTREDGMRIISKHLIGINTVRVAAAMRVGSSYNPFGLYHAFEHMGFEGTERRSADEINSYTEEYLGEYNAYTGLLWTNYYGEAVYSCFHELCDIVFDCYLHSTFPEGRLEKEKGAICGEIRMSHDNDYKTARAALNELLWTKNPLRISGVGIPEYIKSITRELLLETREKWYIPSNTVIVGTGKINHNLLVEKVYEAFPINYATVEHPQWDLEFPGELSAKERFITKPGRNGAILMTGCKIGVPSSERDWHTEWMLLQMLATGANSLLWQELRMKREAYAVWGDINGARRLGYSFVFGTEVDPNEQEETRRLLHDIPCDFPLTASHFMRTKQGLIRNLPTHYEARDQWENSILSQIIDSGKGLSYFNNYVEKHRKILESISFEELCEFRKKIFARDRMACVVLAP